MKKILKWFFMGLGGIFFLYLLFSFFAGGFSGVSNQKYYNDSGSGTMENPSVINSFTNQLGSSPSRNSAVDYEKSSDSVKQISASADRKITKNGSLSLFVKDIADSIDKISSLAKNNGGFVENSSIGGNNNVYTVQNGAKQKRATISIKVPADKFEETFKNIKAIAENVEYENTSAQDVTEEYMDLEAQLKNLKLAEEGYQAIMAKAQKIQDILDVSSRLSDIRGQIERMQGQLQYLSRQVEMSSISVNLTAESEVKIFGIYWKPLLNIKQSFHSMLNDLTGLFDFIVSIIIYLPVIIIVVALIYLLFRVGMIVYKRIKTDIEKRKAEFKI